MRTVYHFTAERFLEGILEHGLTRGKMLKSMNPIKFISGYQWVTTNNSFEQEWARGTGVLPYKRNEVRLTITIPGEHSIKLRPWLQMKFLTPETAELLSSQGDPENWFLFEGTIRPSWIKIVTMGEKNEDHNTL